MGQVFALISLLTISFCINGGSAWAFHVVIDPGHGGLDRGAVHGVLQESEIVLDVSHRLHRLLSEEPGFKVTLTRIDDRPLSLAERINIAHRQGADLLISLHANAAPDPRAKGIELFFQNSLPADEEALYLANLENQQASMLDSNLSTDLNKSDVGAIVSDLHRSHRLRASLRLTQTMSDSWTQNPKDKKPSIKQAPLFVVSQSKIPSVLVEIGFLTNPTEARQLAKTSYRQSIAENIRRSLVSYRARMSPPLQNETVSK